MEEFTPRPALPMQLDVPSRSDLFVSAYRHFSKPKSVLFKLFFGVSVCLIALSIFALILTKQQRVLRILTISILLCVYCVLVIFMVKKRVQLTGQAQARLCGESLHYEITEEGILSSAQDGYGFHPFAYLYKVTAYPDMWLLYFGDKFAPTVIFLFKIAFPNDLEQASFEALLKEKLAGKPMIHRT
ncbi:MAG: hypothetical protein IJJ99_04095 [Oscillospiraceae bacterium]|nr:hypothetical protein [Oscillospiraceae bacterium]